MVTAQGVANSSAQAQAEAEKALSAAKDVQTSRLRSVTDANAQVAAAQAALDEAIRVGNLNVQALTDAKAGLQAASKAAVDAQAAAGAANAEVATAQAAYDTAVQALADANAELGKYTELAKRGSLGFFEEIGATTAVKWLTDPAGTSGLGEGCGTTMENLGDSKSATSLDNMKCALETMAKVNDLRRENGRSELRVYSAIMAASQINLNYTASHKPFYHAPSKYPYGENLAAGYKDPFVGWYDKEKVHYDKDMADGVLDGYDADGNKVGNCGHYFNILEAGYTHYGCASVASRWFHLQDFDGIEGFKRLVTDDEYVEGHEILGVGPNGEYYREDGKPWTCYWEVVTPDDYLREKYGDRSYSAEEYYALFMKYYNKVHGTLDPSYQQAVDDAKAALEAAQAKVIAANAASADKTAAEAAAKQAVASAQAAVSADAQKKAAAQTALSDAQAQAGDAQVQLDVANAEVAGKQVVADAAAKRAASDAAALADAKQTAAMANAQLKAAQAELSDARQALYDMSSDELKAAQKRVAAAKAALASAQASADAKNDALVAAQALAAKHAAEESNAQAAFDKAEAGTLAAQAAAHEASTNVGAAQARVDAIKPLFASVNAAQVASDAAANELSAAKAAEADAQAALDAAQTGAKQAAADLAAAQERADHLGRFATAVAARSAASFEAAWQAGTFGSEWISANVADLEAMLVEKRAVYDRALAAKASAEQRLAGAQENLVVKQAAYDKAAATLAQAEAELADAQAWYDRTHPASVHQAIEAEAVAYLAVDAKVANAKHVANAEGDGSVLVQTGDSVGEVFWIGGVAFVAAGVAIGASVASRRRADAE